MFQPKLTVVTIVYNNVRDIERTVLSVLNQTYSNIEYLVIDGASTDGTLELLKKI
jgi:glycosyltransferase involved in cell wall biosynthesis